MSVEPHWVDKQALLILHEESLILFGGAHGLRDEGLLESALARPQNAWAYQDITEASTLAAAYAYGLVKNHPFVDGNKRAAFLAVGLFLSINGYRLTARQADATETMLALARGDLSEQEMAMWIKQNTKQTLGSN